MTTLEDIAHNLVASHDWHITGAAMQVMHYADELQRERGWSCDYGNLSDEEADVIMWAAIAGVNCEHNGLRLRRLEEIRDWQHTGLGNDAALSKERNQIIRAAALGGCSIGEIVASAGEAVDADSVRKYLDGFPSLLGTLRRASGGKNSSGCFMSDKDVKQPRAGACRCTSKIC